MLLWMKSRNEWVLGIGQKIQRNSHMSRESFENSYSLEAKFFPTKTMSHQNSHITRIERNYFIYYCGSSIYIQLPISIWRNTKLSAINGWYLLTEGMHTKVIQSRLSLSYLFNIVIIQNRWVTIRSISTTRVKYLLTILSFLNIPTEIIVLVVICIVKIYFGGFIMVSVTRKSCSVWSKFVPDLMKKEVLTNCWLKRNRNRSITLKNSKES